MRRAAVVLLVVLLAACGGDDDDAAPASTTGTSANVETTKADDACVLHEGDKVTEAQLSDGYCALEGAPDTIVGFVTYECDGGDTMYAAGADEDDPDGGWVILSGGSGTWHTGAYGPHYADCVAGGSL